MMATNLTNQVRDIAKVTTAVATGDLTKKVTVAVKGEILDLKNTINTMVDQLSTFASEVTRVAREVGTEGKLGGQAEVKGVGGTWKDLTDNVNSMASNLTAQVRNIAEVTISVANGDLSKKITVDVRGEFLQLKETMNTMVDQLRSFASEVTRVAREVGTEGKLGGQAYVTGVAGTWKDLTDSVNFMASNLTAQVRNIATVTTAVANGDLTKKITVDVKGEILELKNTINTMVDQLNSFASEVTRVAREVGTEGKLGGQAQVKGVSGVWKDLTDNVNSMAANLTNQVRGIVKVVTSVANGDLKQKLMVEAKGEIAELAGTINSMIDTLATFADQVTTVAREVGVEGKLGGQAKVPGAAGTWRDLTDNVNQLAANLTTQVRAIAEVATAVTKGDLTRSIAVETQGELAILKDNINQMISNLRDTTQKSTEQDWLKTNLAKFTRMLQGQRDLEAVSKLILSEIAPLLSAQHGVFYLMDAEGDEFSLKLLSSYAYKERKNLSNRFRLGESLVGQCALEKERILITDVPADYIKINSGLGECSPLNIIVLPVIFEQQVKAIIELASFHVFSEVHLNFLDQLTESIGIVLNTIAASMRTEELLKQSQSMADELRSQQQELTETNKRLEMQAKSLQASEELLKSQQEELQNTNEELQEKARLLSIQNSEVERKNKEIEFAKKSLEEKADQLALTSKYKSEFLANMSHELRTPLNSMLILSSMLAENLEQNLSGKQVEFAKTIYSSGSDLLDLINEVLDLAKIESGTISMDVIETFFTDLYDYVERGFRQLANNKNLDFKIELDDNLPKAIYTDSKRLQQVIKNLLSNAFKFTDEGQVTLRIGIADMGWSHDHKILNISSNVLYFSVTDSGIGIPKEKQKIIFESFQQADGTTSRKYGGTGLGLSISREIAHLLGGEITLVSAFGKGSTFTLYLPETYIPIQNTLKDILSDDLYQLKNYNPMLDSAKNNSDIQLNLQSLVINDDRKNIRDGDKILLIVENDINFANTVMDIAREKSFKVIIALNSETALILTKQYKPDAITLDIRLHEMDGWSVLDRLKHDPQTRHIPITIISVNDYMPGIIKHGVLSQLKKPATPEDIENALDNLNSFLEKECKTLLIAVGNEEQCYSILDLIGNSDVNVTAVESGEKALEEVQKKDFECIVITLELTDMSAFELMNKFKDIPEVYHTPIIVLIDRELSSEESSFIHDISGSLVVKTLSSLERLLDETTLYLHRVEANLPENKRTILRQLHQKDAVLSNRKILIVDDDVRNIFALTSLLERHEMEVIYAKNGKDGLEALAKTPTIDMVLMDIMMPEMDGYQTIHAIRNIEQFKELPIIALTAKAMKGDREKCIEAGASDYISKPVNNEQLLSLLRVWLYQN